MAKWRRVGLYLERDWLRRPTRPPFSGNVRKWHRGKLPSRRLSVFTSVPLLPMHHRNLPPRSLSASSIAPCRHYLRRLAESAIEIWEGHRSGLPHHRFSPQKQKNKNDKETHDSTSYLRCTT